MDSRLRLSTVQLLRSQKQPCWDEIQSLQDKVSNVVISDGSPRVYV
jgi:hypothetical protein